MQMSRSNTTNTREEQRRPLGVEHRSLEDTLEQLSLRRSESVQELLLRGFGRCLCCILESDHQIISLLR